MSVDSKHILQVEDRRAKELFDVAYFPDIPSGMELAEVLLSELAWGKVYEADCNYSNILRRPVCRRYHHQLQSHHKILSTMQPKVGPSKQGNQ
jgi:hypothetical protein